MRRFFNRSKSKIMLRYKRYSGYVEYDDEAHIFHGEVLDTKDIITFQEETVNEIEQAFRDSIDDYLEFCAERGEQPDKPFFGKFVLRMPSILVEPEKVVFTSRLNYITQMQIFYFRLSSTIKSKIRVRFYDFEDEIQQNKKNRHNVPINGSEIISAC